MRRNLGRQMCCIFIAIVFALGILGNPLDEESFAPRCERSDGVLAFESSYGDREARWRPVSIWHGIDDFHAVSDAGSLSQALQDSMRAAPLLLLAIAIVFCYGMIPAAHWMNFGEEKPLVFCIVSFLHRADGKKKPCFEEG